MSFVWPACKWPLVWKKRRIECDRPKGHRGQHETVIEKRATREYQERVLVTWA